MKSHSYTQAKNFKLVIYSRVVQRQYVIADRNLTMGSLCTVIALVRQPGQKTVQQTSSYPECDTCSVHASRHVAAQRDMYTLWEVAESDIV